MKTRLTLLLLSLSFSLGACKPAANPDDSAPKPAFDHTSHRVTPPAEWTTCARETECVAVSAGCCYQMAVSADHEIDARKSIEANVAQGVCTSTCDPSAECVDRRCRVRAP